VQTLWRESSYPVFDEWIMPSLQTRTRTSKEQRITIVVHCFRFISDIAILYNGDVKSSLLQSIRSPRSKFFLRFLRSHRRIFEYSPQIHVFAGSPNDFHLFRIASRISPYSPAWSKALAKLQNGESEQQILEFLELAAIAEGLGGK